MHRLNDSSLITLRMCEGRLLHKVGVATAKEQPSIVVNVLIIGRCNKDSTYSFEGNEFSYQAIDSSFSYE